MHSKLLQEVVILVLLLVEVVHALLANHEPLRRFEHFLFDHLSCLPAAEPFLFVLEIGGFRPHARDMLKAELELLE